MTKPAFIFDLDGVITDTAHYHYLAWKDLANGLGVDFSLKDNEQLKGVDRRGSLDFILKRLDKTFSEAEIEELMHKKNEDYKQRIHEISSKDILPNVENILNKLHDHGHQVGLASASKNALNVIKQLGIAHQFDYVADAAKIPNSKPAPDVFLNVAQAFDISPAKCIGIEDAAAGVKAIKSAGMFAVGVGLPDILAEADIVIPSMQQFDYTDIMQQAKLI